MERLRFLFCVFVLFEAGPAGSAVHEDVALGDVDEDGEDSAKLGKPGLEALCDLCGAFCASSIFMSWRAAAG